MHVTSEMHEVTPTSGELDGQARLLRSLSAVEKSQPDDRIICSRIDFASDAATLWLPHGVRIAVALDTDPPSLIVALDSFQPPLGGIRRESVDTYPLEITAASVWAELHFDLARVGYLSALDESIRYEAIRLDHDVAIVGVSVERRADGRPVRAFVPVRLDSFPVHTADELGEAIMAVAR